MGSKAAACLHLVLLLLVSGTALSHWTVKILPGFPGELPFKLETGYISVGNVEFFYYFVESEGNPGADPLLLYINGGPGCSGLNGFFYQIGPLRFNTTDYIGGLPTLEYETSTWAKTASIIFLDAPVGAGFSYATTAEAWNTTDTQMAKQADQFLRNWLDEHPDFMSNPVYLGSDSYAGIYTPILAQDIINGNEAGVEPFVNLKGFSIGCPHTHTDLETNTKIPFAHRLALISDSMYESAKTSCNENYADPVGATCTEALSAITQCIELISRQNVLEPNCAFLSPKAREESAQRSLRENTNNFIIPSPKKSGDLWCKVNLHISLWIFSILPWSTQLTPMMLSPITKILLIQACKSWFSGSHVQILCWCLWLRRCNARMETKMDSVQSVWNSIKYWAAFVGEKIKASTNFTKRDGDILQLFNIPVKQKPPSSLLLKWSTPKSGWFKLNVDGSSLGNPGPSGAGGVIQTSNGHFISGFALIIGVQSNNVVELWGLLQGIRIARFLGLNNIEIEMDSMIVIDWLKNKRNGLWHWKNIGKN